MVLTPTIYSSSTTFVAAHGGLIDTHRLTDLQFAILRILCERGEATVTELREALRERRHLAPTTVATLLTRLERRKVVGRRTAQRQYIYRALVTEAEVQRSMIGELTERLFDGDVVQHAKFLLSSSDITAGDIARIRELLERAAPARAAAPVEPVQ